MYYLYIIFLSLSVIFENCLTLTHQDNNLLTIIDLIIILWSVYRKTYIYIKHINKKYQVIELIIIPSNIYFTCVCNNAE